ncbi:hypothetical protein NDI52_28505 [Leptolyngbya sp. PL-A3]|uniref:hypothetical protein n=1 Tax=Leptolyngbya sp. PL-A3 TaxID=2933911 RepID=UPI0032992A98
MSGFEIFLDLIVVVGLFLLVGRDHSAAPQPAPRQQDDTPPTKPPIDTEAVVKEAIATMPPLTVAELSRLTRLIDGILA